MSVTVSSHSLALVTSGLSPHFLFFFKKFFSNTLQPNCSFPPLLPVRPPLPSPPDPFLLCFPPEKSKPPLDVN